MFHKMSDSKFDNKSDHMPKSCISCGRCTSACIFLQKYGLHVGELADRPELFYSCFLCDRCGEVCPIGISGRELVLAGRLALTEGKACGEKARLPFRGYGGLLWEKDPYRFANYRALGSGSVLWTGCNFTGFFPKTEKILREIFRIHGIGTVHDCCQKPVYELGLSEDADRNLKRIEKRLLDSSVRELVMVCPNCYYFMKERLPEEIRCVTVYQKLAELGIGEKIETKLNTGFKKTGGNETNGGKETIESETAADFPLYLPCPDRENRIFLRDLTPFLPKETETKTFSELQCCGLGGCASVREPELSAELSRNAIRMAGEDGRMYTYCASCVGQFRRKGFSGAQHVLPLILGVNENPSGGCRPLLNRAAGSLLMK